MFPPSFGQTQINDINAFVKHCDLKYAQDPTVFEHMEAYVVGSRLWMADLLNKADLDTQTREKVQAMIDVADCDVRFEPANNKAEASITALTISRLRNTLMETADPLVDSHANYAYKSLDVAIISQRAIIVNGLDYRVDPRTQKKCFDSDAHEAAHNRWLKDLVIETVGLREYLEAAKTASIKQDFVVISYVTRLLRSFVKPLKVGTFSLETALAIHDLMHEPAYASLKSKVSTLIARRVYKDKKAAGKYKYVKERNPQADIEPPKKLMPDFIKKPEDLYDLIISHVEKVCGPQMKALEKDYMELSAYVEVAPKSMEAYYQRKYKALMGFFEEPKLIMSPLKDFPECNSEPMNGISPSGWAYSTALVKAVRALKSDKEKIMAVIDANEAIIENLTKQVIQYSIAKSLSVPKEVNTKPPKVKYFKKVSHKTVRTHPQANDEDIDEAIKAAAAMIDAAQSSQPLAVVEPVARTITYVKETSEAYAVLLNIETDYNREKLTLLLASTMTVYDIMKAHDSSFLHVVAVLKQFHDKDDIDFYAKDIIKKSVTYRKIVSLMKNVSTKERLAKIHFFDTVINNALSQSEMTFRSVAGGVDPVNYGDETNNSNVVYQTLASCTWVNLKTEENMMNVVALMRHLSHFYSIETCAIGLKRAVFADHHFHLKMTFPLKLKLFLDWLFVFNPFHTTNHPHLTFRDIQCLVKTFFPDYVMSREMVGYILGQITMFKTYPYDHAHSTHIETEIAEITREVLSRVMNRQIIFELREDSFNNPEMAANDPVDLFNDEVEALKVNQNTVGNTFYILHFLKHSQHCANSSSYREIFSPLYRLLQTNDNAMIDPVTSNSEEKAPRPAQELNAESMQVIVVSLMLVMGHLGMALSVRDNPRFTSDEYNYAAEVTGNCIRGFIVSAIALATNKALQSELYVLYHYVKQKAHTNLAFSKVFMCLATPVHQKSFVEDSTSLTPEENQFRKQALVLMNAMDLFINSDKNDASEDIAHSLVCEEVLEDDDETDTIMVKDKGAGLIAQMKI